MEYKNSIIFILLVYSSYLTLRLNNQVQLTQIPKISDSYNVESPPTGKNKDKFISPDKEQKSTTETYNAVKQVPTIHEETQKTLQNAEQRAAVVGRIISLNNSQVDKLTNYFNGDKSESFNDIVGAEGAAIYFKEVQEAYANNLREEEERDVFYLSRKYGLTLEQEKGLFATVTDINNKINQSVSENQSLTKLELAKFQAKLEQDLKEQEFKKIFSQEQLNQYLEDSKQSTNNNMLLFH